MSRDLDDLTPEFKVKAEELIRLCDESGYPMRPYFTLRTPFEQGKLWRQSRSSAKVQEKITYLKNQDAEFLAYCIESVGPQNGDPVTNAIPGLSWHQWGEGLDCYWLLNGDAEWSETKEVNGVNGYKNYVQKALSLNLTAGGLWTSIQDWPHVQMQSADSPQDAFSLQEINRTMKERFGT